MRSRTALVELMTSALDERTGASGSPVSPKPFQPILLPARTVEEVHDDRLAISPGDDVLLIIEDDPHYAKVLLDLARERGFRGLVAMRGSEGLPPAWRHWQQIETCANLSFEPDAA